VVHGSATVCTLRAAKTYSTVNLPGPGTATGRVRVPGYCYSSTTVGLFHSPVSRAVVSCLTPPSSLGSLLIVFIVSLCCFADNYLKSIATIN
jgi:hypothetical protein